VVGPFLIHMPQHQHLPQLIVGDQMPHELLLSLPIPLT